MGGRSSRATSECEERPKVTAGLLKDFAFATALQDFRF